MSDVNTDENEIQAEVQAVIEQAKAAIAPRYAGFSVEPEVYYIAVCGQHMVCTPMSLQQKEAWLKGAKANEMKAPELLLKEVVFWCRGQREDGPIGAMKHLRALASLGGSLSLLLDKAAGEYLRLIDETGGQAAGKKQ